ncbi:thioredoxin domain-containing protein, partial [Draconibacterium sp. IB214405]|uniref:DsbA family protein n=1 Tax=Draconibacterium sp. IB214405 TaxID=3097352 RepID=UPI002A141DE1
QFKINVYLSTFKLSCFWGSLQLNLVEKNKVNTAIKKFKRNKEIFRLLLEKNEYKEFHITKDSLIFGNPDAPITFTAFLNFNCIPCQRAYVQLRQLIDNCSEIKVHAIFSSYNQKISKKMISTLYYLYTKKGPKHALIFLDQWYNTTTRNGVKKNVDSQFVFSEIHEIIENENTKLFEKHKIYRTPSIFINGYKFPNQYEYHDTEYFKDELKLLTREDSP